MDEPSPSRPRQLTPQVVSEVRQVTAILDQGPTSVSSSLTSTTSAIQALSTASIASTTAIATTPLYRLPQHPSLEVGEVFR